MKKNIICLLILILSFDVSSAIEISRTIVAHNAYSTQQMNIKGGLNLITYNGNQYIGYWNNDAHMVLGKRPIDGAWTFYTYDGTNGRPEITVIDDYHNFISFGIDRDGYFHVCYDMHARPLRYRKTTSPEDVSALTDELAMTGTHETQASYPLFFNDKNGVLYFTFRNGVSENGDQYLYIYDETTGWTYATGTTTQGLFMSGTTSSPVNNPYVGIPVVDSNNVIHFAWNWRESGGVTEARDMLYVKLENGVFKKADGTVQPLPIVTANADIIDALPAGSGLKFALSKSGIAVDANNLPYVTYYKKDGSGHTQLYVAHWTGSAWEVSNPITNLQVYNISDTIASPIIFIGNDNVKHVFFREPNIGQGVYVYSSSDLVTWKKETIYPDVVGTFRFSADTKAWKDRNVAYVLVSDIEDNPPTSNAVIPCSPTDLWVVRYDPNGTKVDFSGVTLR